MIAIDFEKRHKGKEVKRNTISHILKNPTWIFEVDDFEVGDNLKELKRENGPKYIELEIGLLACFKHVFTLS